MMDDTLSHKEKLLSSYGLDCKLRGRSEVPKLTLLPAAPFEALWGARIPAQQGKG